MLEDKSINQPRLGMEGAGGTTKPGDILKRSNFRVYFVGGLAALGVAWFLTSVKPFSSKTSDLAKGTKVPTVPYEMDKVEHPEGPTLKTGPKVPSPHSGVAAGRSEGSSPHM